ncbi:MAG: porin family protein [Proteobacteria bacterium]|nr:porin family protein [Pseudomonadota bacterium]
MRAITSLTLIAASNLIAGAALAGDGFGDAIPSPISWSGLYVGMEAGYNWGDVDWNLNYPYAGPVRSDRKFDTDHFLGGGFVGLQRQFGHWVVGGEVGVDAGFSSQNIGGVDLYLGNDVGTLETKVGPLFSATARLGYAQDRWLAYVKGGYAGANISLNSDDGVPPDYYSHSSDWHNGWKAGGGIEYALLPSTSVGLEYDYVDLGSVADTVPLTYSDGSRVGPSTTHSADFTTQMIMARVTFRLERDEPVEPLK